MFEVRVACERSARLEGVWNCAVWSRRGGDSSGENKSYLIIKEVLWD